MHPSKCKLSGQIWFPRHCINPERRMDILRSIPPEFRPTYFSKSEFVRRARDKRVDNVDALRAFVASGYMHHFHGDGYYVLISSSESGRNDLGFYSSDLEHHVSLVESWMQLWTGPPCAYGYFCAPSEHRHRNGKSIRFSNTGSGGIYGLIGVDYQRYLPGLYWLNVLSNEYVRERQLDLAHLAAVLQAQLTARPWGYILRLYDRPEQWTEKAQAVDDYLFETPGCFSRRRVGLPEAIRFDEAHKLIVRLHKEWP